MPLAHLGGIMSIVRNNVLHWGDPIAAEADRIGVDAAKMHAVAAVEVGAIEHPGLGPPIVRFEVHMFLKYVGTSNVVQLRDAETAWHKDAHWYRNDPDANWERVHSGSQSDEWGALVRCMEEDPVAAWKSASYGVGQLMGWHADLLGFDSARRMAGKAMAGGIPAQIKQWGKYIERDKDGAMLDALRSGDWETFVRFYNGPGQIPYYTNALVMRYEEAVDVLANPPSDAEAIALDTWRARQQALVALGYDPGPVDGVKGPSTTRALKAFQSDHGLNPDGWWGRYTEEHMHRALAEAGITSIGL
jgi:hypothetical protein